MTDEQANNPNGHEFGKEAEEYISKLPSFLQQVAWNAFLTGASTGAKKYKNATAYINTSERFPKERQKIYKQIPFNIGLAKKIQAGEIEGRIFCDLGTIRIIEFDMNFVPGTIEGSIIATFLLGAKELLMYDNRGCCTNRNHKYNLFIELPEEAPKQDSFNKKLHDTAEVLATPKHEFKVGDKVSIDDDNEEDVEIYEIVKIRENLAFLNDGSTIPLDGLVLRESKHEFKPFDKVLVREDDLTSWQAAFFSHIEYFEDGEQFAITTSGDNYNLANNEIIPYEGNEYLVGTSDKPKEE